MALAENTAAAVDLKGRIAGLMAGFSVETTPGAAAKIGNYREHLFPGTTVYITFLPGSDLAETIALARRLRAEGFNPVPHLAARSLPDRATLEDSLIQLTGEAGVRQVLLIGGALAQPVGAFSDTMQVLDTGLFDTHGIKKIGVAGHPEGSPDISETGIRQALQWKNRFAERTDAELYIVTQFCFEAAPIIDWERRIRAEGNRLPIHIGVPGLATIRTLMGHAKACGVGPSMRFLIKQAGNVTKLLATSAPDRLVSDLAAHIAAEPECAIAGLHIYPLGGLRKSARWCYGVLDGKHRLRSDGGFEVDVDLG